MTRAIVFEDEFVVGQAMKFDSRKADSRAAEVGARAFNPRVYLGLSDVRSHVNGEGKSSRSIRVGAPMREVRSAGEEEKYEEKDGLHGRFDGLGLQTFKSSSAGKSVSLGRQNRRARPSCGNRRCSGRTHVQGRR